MFGKTTEYAIRALVYIYIENKKGRRPGFKEVAKSIDSPEQFTGKVLQNLSRKGFMCSVKGRGGGFFFDLSAPELRLYDVIQSFENPQFFSGCGFGLNECNDANPCPLHTEYAFIRDEVYHLVISQTIQSLAEKVISNQAVLNRNSALPLTAL